MSLHSLFFIFGFFPIFLITYYRAKDCFKEIIIFFGSYCFYYLCSEEAIYPKLALFSTSTGTNNSDGIGLCTFNLEMQ